MVKNKTNKCPILAVDGVIIKDKRILLVKRKVYPFLNYWCLPGGHIEYKYGEKPKKAILREMEEELGVSVKIKKIIGVYSGLKRDPRGYSFSVAYLLEIGKGNISLNYEASKFKFFSFENLPKKIGFDHKEIIKDTQKILKIPTH